MANYFVDSTTGDDGDDGTTMDLAFATMDYALASGGLVAGDYLWIRRVHVEYAGDPTSDIVIPTGANPTSQKHVIGWPRGSDATADQATWVNGSTTVDLVTTLSMDREKHLGRFITGPDGESYLISKITDSNTFIINREYAGASVSAAAGAFTIQADEDYALAQAIDDSGWTIDVAAYTADADDMPTFDFKDTAYQIMTNHVSRSFVHFHNLEFRDTTDTSGIVQVTTGRGIIFRGCLFHQSNNNRGFSVTYGEVVLDRCVLSGSENIAHSAQELIYYLGSYIKIRNTIIYGAGNSGISGTDGVLFLEDVNLGVEIANEDADITAVGMCLARGKDVRFGATNGDIDWSSSKVVTKLEFENYNKTLGAHKTLNSQGTLTKLDVVSGSGDPYKRTGGADSVLEILYDRSDLSHNYVDPPQNYLLEPIFEHEFEATNDIKDYRYYVQAEGIVPATKLWIECEYVSAHDDTSEYTQTLEVSDEAFTARADAEDWAEYMEVTGIEPAVGSKVRIKCYCSYYNATNKIYIDPKVVITDG